jgi:hypothetical protein
VCLDSSESYREVLDGCSDWKTYQRRRTFFATLKFALNSRRFAPAFRLACLSFHALASSGDDGFVLVGIPAAVLLQLDMQSGYESLLTILSLK